jgi:leucyl-tRNA synthetase
MILGMSYKDSRGALVPADLVEHGSDGAVHKETREKLVEFPAKMSKSLKNVVNPDDVIKAYGADSMRLYEMFMGPLEAVKPWNTNGVEGVFRFLRKAWRMIIEAELTDAEMSKDQLKLLHETIKKVSGDLDTLGFNTAISQLMIFVNGFSKDKQLPREAAETFVKLLAPFAPHIGEELWQHLGHEGTISYVPWPVHQEEYLKVAEVEVLIQVLGKPKARMMMPADASQDNMGKLALENSEVKAAVEGKTVRKIIAVPGRLVNIVAN